MMIEDDFLTDSTAHHFDDAGDEHLISQRSRLLNRIPENVNQSKIPRCFNSSHQLPSWSPKQWTRPP